MIELVKDSGKKDTVVLTVYVERCVREQVDDLSFRLGWNRARVVNELLKQAVSQVKVIDNQSVDLEEDYVHENV